MHSFDIAEARSLLRRNAAIPAGVSGAAPPSVARGPVLELAAAIRTGAANPSPKPRLLISFGMTACLLAGLIYETGLAHRLEFPHPGAAVSELERTEQGAGVVRHNGGPDPGYL